ncbi:zinc finger protein [Clarias magur]|uniref:Zinc finger protein n=1 Tax=Clarias magur TaxID=1594786 RepID=A0A8J4X9R6_CLAMG|nr:zinc finger protein [Clarias magur]
MADISLLYAEVCQLRKTVSHLEERLSQALNRSSQATPALCSVCKADLNTSDSEHRHGEDPEQSVCGDAAEEWPDGGPQESEPGPSVHLYSDVTPSESPPSEHALQTPLNCAEQNATRGPVMMCSVTLMDCRTKVEVNGNAAQEEDPDNPEGPDEACDDFCPSTGNDHQHHRGSQAVWWSVPLEKDRRLLSGVGRRSIVLEDCWNNELVSLDASPKAAA